MKRSVDTHPETGDDDLVEELRLSALSGLRWRVFVGLALVWIFAGSHPHAELLGSRDRGLPAGLALPLIGFITTGQWLDDHRPWPILATVLAYVWLDLAFLRRLPRGQLEACGRVTLLTLAAFVLALNLPLVLLLTGHRWD